MRVLRTGGMVALLLAATCQAAPGSASTGATPGPRAAPDQGSAPVPDYSDAAAGKVSPSASPALALPGLDGTSHSLAEWRGKVVVLNFWAAWCGQCQTEIRHFVAFQKAVADRGLQIVGVGIDAAEPLRNVHRTLQINYPVLVAAPEKHGGLLASWGNRQGVIPYTVVLDRDGRVVYTHRGPMDSSDLDENVVPLLDRR